MNLADKHRHELRFCVFLKHTVTNTYAGYDGLFVRRNKALSMEVGADGLTVEEVLKHFRETVTYNPWILSLKADQYEIESYVV